MDDPKVTNEPREIVGKLVRIISNDFRLDAADSVVERYVLIHMDSSVHRGIDTWKKWIVMLRVFGKLRGLRMEPERVSVSGDKVVLEFKWTGLLKHNGRPIDGARTNLVKYHVSKGKIQEIWTHKRNYVDVFGRWIRIAAFYRALLLRAIFYFRANRLEDGSGPQKPHQSYAKPYQ